MKPTPTRTLNPLPFGDLEPKRFEDLVRQLCYDFRKWSSLEATGRSGSDDGFDARGYEISGELEPSKPEPDVDEEDVDDISSARGEERLWQIQCKREKSITPKKIETILSETLNEDERPYGVIMASACDFSKTTRDVFRRTMLNHGVEEFFLWGKSELEDFLFQPKNDHLLFAYFGISLVVRQRQKISDLRRILSIKKKCANFLGSLGGISHKEILIRDINNVNYPYTDEIKISKDNPPWRKFYFVRHQHNGIVILLKKFPAYFISDEAGIKEWDYTNKVDFARIDDCSSEETVESRKEDLRVRDFFGKIPDRFRAHLVTEGLILYENILEVDPIGDALSQIPHLYIKKTPAGFASFYLDQLRRDNNYSFDHHNLSREKHDSLRIAYFPSKFPKAERENENQDRLEKYPPPLGDGQ